MKTELSVYLESVAPILEKLIAQLSEDYSYVSILGVDTCGKRYTVQKTGISITESSWTERGFVVRVHNGTGYSEYSFNDLKESDLNKIIGQIHKSAVLSIPNPDTLLSLRRYPVISEEKTEKEFFGEVEILPDEMDDGQKIQRLSSFTEKGLDYSPLMIDYKSIFENVHVSKVFYSTGKKLRQSYVWSQGYLSPIVQRDDKVKSLLKSFSGLKGPELLDEMEPFVERVAEGCINLLDAEQIKPGEYTVICSPEISGLIAHEAFGHGVEMDMVLKNRAKAARYMGKKVASEKVTMHDGAAAATEVSSYLFDDEGTLGSDTVIIDKGILKEGISDLLSALSLGVRPTGNGKRESYERKAYSRMTNTYFAGGNDKLDDMIASTPFGYLLEGYTSGMEDPKNWGIQCMIVQGREIRDGKLTGKIVSPVIMTGNVLDLLNSVSMVSPDVELSGSGACGKGYKEFVKVSCGGPYIKTKARLG